jgi:hypothetical protein
MCDPSKFGTIHPVPAVPERDSKMVQPNVSLITTIGFPCQGRSKEPSFPPMKNKQDTEKIDKQFTPSIPDFSGVDKKIDIC